TKNPREDGISENPDEFRGAQSFGYAQSDTDGCNLEACDDGQASGYSVSFPDDKGFCVCSSNPVYDLGGLAFPFSRVPIPIRQRVKGLTAASSGKGGGAGSGGDRIVFWEPNLPTNVWIHESAHSFDQGKSASSEWAAAVSQDSCVPDRYAQTSYAEDYAQVVVIWNYLVLSDKVYDGSYDCLRNQLNFVRANLTEADIKRGM
ncbi:hypothetical protein PROFUN_15381, partial [Planoprotostelium fungivorum]